jgi:membrane-bound lytic murein transglycosylase D
MFRLVFVFWVGFFLIIGCKSESAKHVVRPTQVISNNEGIDFSLPDTILFCDELLPVSDLDFIERLDKEIIVNTFYHSSTIGIMKRSTRFFPIIDSILKAYNVPPDFKYLAVIESGLQNVESPSGAMGFWQFMPSTAKEYGLQVSKEVDERNHLEKSTKAACSYLLSAYQKLGSWTLVAASYNRGVKGIENDLRWQGVDNYFDAQLNSETGRYVFRILALKIILENPKRFGYTPIKMGLYSPLKAKSIKIKKSISNIAEWARGKGVNYKIIRKLNPWIKTNQLTVKDNHFTILIPKSEELLAPFKIEE